MLEDDGTPRGLLRHLDEPAELVALDWVTAFE